MAVDIFGQHMDMEKLSFENVNTSKIGRQVETDERLNLSPRTGNKGKQTSLSDSVD